MKCFSLFSGIGGFDIAVQKLGIEIVGACEIDKYARTIFTRHFPNVRLYEDATKINPNNLPDFDLLVAGFPCQSFSVAGQRRGFEDTRGTLFFEIVRIAKQKRPQYMLLENVKGLLSHKGGETVRKIYQTLDELGYDVQARVVNTKDFLPQNRERIFFICYLRGKCGREVFSIRGENKESDKHFLTIHKKDKKKHFPTTKLRQVGNIDTKGHNSLWGRVYHPEGIAPTLNAVGGGLGAKTGLFAIPTQLCNMTMNGRRQKSNNEPSFTLDAQGGQGVQTYLGIRKLTPLECERLQGFLDGWTKELSDTQRYKCCGNAVSVPVVEHVLKLMHMEQSCY